MRNFLDEFFTCFHSTLSIISAPGALLSVIGGLNNDTYWRRKKGIVNRDTNKWTIEQTKICIKRIKTAEIVTPRPLLFLKKGEREVTSTRCNVSTPSYINFSKCLENSHMYNLNWGLWAASFEGKKEQSLKLIREWMK